MLFFPNAKINIGLNITSKRTDGFHNIETVFCPVGLSDVLEFVENGHLPPGYCTLDVTGTSFDGNQEDNLVVKAYRLLYEDFQLPALDIHLHKIIPVGAGLGGGSADAAFMLRYLNIHFKLNLTDAELCQYASRLGSDCAFFNINKPVFAYERGNAFREIHFKCGVYHILLVHPGIHVNTASAYAGVSPGLPSKPIESLIRQPVSAWKDQMKNDFEDSVFRVFPLLKDLKKEMYGLGAAYASMSGSGSTIYGMFTSEIPDNRVFDPYFTWKGKIAF